MSKKQMKEEKGITLVALVVTIIILLILAGVTLSLALSDTGLFKKAQNAADKYKSEQTKEEGLLTDLEEEIDKYESKNPTPEEPPKETPKGPNGKPLIPEVAKTTEHGTIEGEDKLGNPVTVPGQFKVVEGETVEDGIVIEDSEGNQFVWIPVSNTDGDNNANTDPTATDLITLQSGKKVEITLGRYTFDTTNGTPKLVQNGSEYSEEKTEFVINNYFKENTNDGRPSGVARAKLKEFVESVEKNHGYYIGRYEASFASGDTPKGSYGFNGNGTTSIMSNQKPAVKATKTDDNTLHTNNDAISIKEGDLWRYITQEDASKVCQNMYNADNMDIESDLVNSYAWDTAIVYIQAMGNNNYANATRDRSNNTELKNTGDTGDIVCNIYDMAGNLFEWTTEYSTSTDSNEKYHCIFRGGVYYDSYYYTATRYNYYATYSYFYLSFRPLIYMK